MGDRGIFPKELADRYVENSGQKYRPSNGTEGMIFEEHYCQDCKLGDKQCLIWGNAFFFDKANEKYPSELQYGPDGQPTCTAFDEIDERFIVREGVLIDRKSDRHMTEVPEIDNMQDAADFLNSAIKPAATGADHD